MELIKKNIKKYLITIISILIIVMLLIACKNQLKWVSWHLNSIINSGTQISFVFPFINKNIANDTFFTIAIGNNILKNGITNIDTLTWHENLEFPHSRNI